jgi:hypothetical protein
MSLDIAFLGDPANTISALSFADNTANDGVYKLVQRIMILLFTSEDSQYNAGFGTEIPNSITSANISDKDLIQGTFMNEMSQIAAYLQQTTPFGTPADEQLDRYEVIVVEEDDMPDQLFVELTIFPASGTGTTVRIPVSEIYNVEDSEDG